jgi:hypothetical protein
MRRKIAFFLTIAFMGALGWIPQVVAKERYLTQFNTKYGTSSISTCTLCHPDSLNKVNSFGSDFATASIGNHTFNAALESRDSDRDGFSNLAEIQARTFPGDASSKPAGSDTTPPVISSFSIPSTWNSLTVPITSFVATDNVGVTGYALSESGSAPSSGWSGSAPSSYTFSSAGNKTLYAWARDAAGNISSPQSAQVTIRVGPPPPPPDTTPPVISSFSIPSTWNSLTVPITSFVATDNVGVTGYALSESGSAPSSGWSGSAPSSYTFSSAGNKTLYAWARDAAGNISSPQSAQVTIRVGPPPPPPDTTPPVISSFSIPSTWNSLTVPITSFVATDNVGVTGYALSESGSAPSSGWSGSAPSSYTFSSAGNKTLYAWARDAAGNISSPQSAQLSITLDSTPPPLPEPLVGRWIRLKIFLGNGHGWSELGLVGEGKRLTTYLHLESWDPQSRILHGLLYLQLGSDQKDLEKDLLTLPLDSLVTSSSRRKFWATSQFTEDPSTLFSVKFEGRFVKGELKWGILRGKHKPEDGRQSRAWFWLRGKLIEESQVPEDILNFLEVQKDFSMNRSCNYG